MPLSFDSEEAFRASFPNAFRYRKVSDPRFPILAITLTETVYVRKAWGPGGSVIEVECPAHSHVLLVNTATGEVYPCAANDRRLPVGYQKLRSPPSLQVDSFVSETIWAVQVRRDTPITGLEGPTEAPAGSWLAFSNAKNLYFITNEKWIQMGFQRVY